MPQVISCPKCSTRMQVPDDATGKQVKCPSCQNLFVSGAPALQPAGAAAGAASGSVPRPAAAPPPKAAAPPPPKAQQPAAAPTKCPACGSDLLPGAVACMDCGFLIQAGET